MALTQAQLQAVVAFARTNRLDPQDMCAALEIALMTPFIDANSGIQMVTLSAGADGVTITTGWEAARWLLDYWSRKANGGLVAQNAEFRSQDRYPGLLQ